MNIKDFARVNDYPGRLIGAGMLQDDFVIVYAITARSASSRNRILVFENGIVRTEVADKTQDVGVKNITLYPAIIKTKKSSFVISRVHA